MRDGTIQKSSPPYQEARKRNDVVHGRTAFSASGTPYHSVTQSESRTSVLVSFFTDAMITLLEVSFHSHTHLDVTTCRGIHLPTSHVRQRKPG